jgi:hypothetical protein
MGSYVFMINCGLSVWITRATGVWGALHFPIITMNVPWMGGASINLLIIFVPEDWGEAMPAGAVTRWRGIRISSHGSCKAQQLCTNVKKAAS